MQIKYLILVFAVCFSQTYTFDANYAFDRFLVRLLKRTRGADGDMNTFLQCYSYYTGKMDEAQRVYKVKFQECVNSAEAGIVAADEATAKQRQDLYSQIGGSCNSSVVCQVQKQAIDEFNCISNESARMSRKLTEIANDAISQRQELEKQHKLVRHNLDVCAKLNQDALQEQTNDILDEWDRCNAGQVTIPPQTERPSTPPS